jgi:hypothetical protein
VARSSAGRSPHNRWVISLTEVRGELRIQADTLNTKHEKRDTHPRSADFST